MRVAEVITEAREAMQVKQVFGQPYERDGVTVALGFPPDQSGRSSSVTARSAGSQPWI